MKLLADTDWSRHSRNWSCGSLYEGLVHLQVAQRCNDANDCNSYHHHDNGRGIRDNEADVIQNQARHHCGKKTASPRTEVEKSNNTSTMFNWGRIKEPSSTADDVKTSQTSSEDVARNEEPNVPCDSPKGMKHWSKEDY